MAALTLFAAYLLGLLAGAIELGTWLALFAPQTTLGAGEAVLGHGAATVLAVIAARLRLVAAPGAPERTRQAQRVELDLVAATALFVPLFGPALAWLFPRRVLGRTVDAHAWFAQHERMRGRARLHAGAPRDPDDVLPHDVMSFAEVLRRGSLDYRRNALRKLGQRGTPRHLAMLRDALFGSDAELRLCAYGEIQKLARPHEDALAELQQQLSALPPSSGRKSERHAVLTAAAEAHQTYAASGLLDPEMRRYHLQRGMRCAEEAWLADPRQWRVATAYARTLSDLGEHERALRAFAHLDQEEGGRPEVCVAQAEIAFRSRDFAAALAAGERILRQSLPLPDWLGALVRRLAAGAGAKP